MRGGGSVERSAWKQRLKVGLLRGGVDMGYGQWEEIASSSDDLRFGKHGRWMSLVKLARRTWGGHLLEEIYEMSELPHTSRAIISLSSHLLRSPAPVAGELFAGYEQSGSAGYEQAWMRLTSKSSLEQLLRAQLMDCQ